MIGQTLAHYKILEKLGSGGMGDVYLAEDTKLGRKVALKILPPDLAENEERRARFQREAKATAALDHPNIVQVFSVEQADGVHFITMQLVQGKTLTALLPKNGFSVNDFFEVAIPLADAIAAAHEAGMTHRDIKPDNIMLSEEGGVKVLDFGLAKPARGFVGSEGPTAAKTKEGVIVGTVSYMSPEQAEGKPVDHRSDVFSLGVLFYEMLTGRRPFEGGTPASTISSILKDDPPSITELKPTTSRDLTKLVRRCLAKEPIRRYQSVIDIRNELEEANNDLVTGDSAGPAAATRYRARASLFAALAATAIGAGLFGYALRSRFDIADGGGLPRFDNPVQVTFTAAVENYPTWSPDGGRVAFESNASGDVDVWVAQVGGGEPVNLTESHAGLDAKPSWSPDGTRIAFASERDSVGYFVMSALGGTPRRALRLSEPIPTGGTSAPQWSADGTELAAFIEDGGKSFIEIVALESGDARRLAAPRRSPSPHNLSWSPNGRLFAYVDAVSDRAEVTRAWIVRASDGEAIPLTEGEWSDWSPTWWRDDHEVFFISNRGGAMDLWVQRLDRNGRPDGAPTQMTTGVGMRNASFSRDGSRLAYSQGRWVGNLWRIPASPDSVLSWGDAEAMTSDHAIIEFSDISRDGRVLAFSSDRAGNQDLWLLDLESRELRQLTTNPTPDWNPRWSPDGEQIAFYSYRSGNRDIWIMPVSGGRPTQLTQHEAPEFMPSWSPDGESIAFISTRSASYDVWVMPATGGRARQLTSHAGIDETNLVWSPDGRWLYFGVPGHSHISRVIRDGGQPEPIFEGDGVLCGSPDGDIYFWRDRDLWVRTLEDGDERRLFDLRGRRGSLITTGGTCDDEHVYFSWFEDLGDIWVMDVVTDEDS